MRRPTALSTFVVTAAVLAVIVAISLRKAGAESNTAADTTSIVYLPVAALTHGDSARVHVVNVSKDLSAPALRFMIMFADTRGVLLGPEKVCEVRASETCTVTLSSSDCPAGFTKPGSDRDHDGDRDKQGPRPPRCEFRAVVVGETLACSSTSTDLPEWTTNLELVDPSGGSKFVAGPTAVLKLPRESCTGGSDASGPPPDLSTSPPSDLTTPPSSDLTTSPPSDLTTPPPADLLTLPDLVVAPPDISSAAAAALRRPKGIN